MAKEFPPPSGAAEGHEYRRLGRQGGSGWYFGSWPSERTVVPDTPGGEPGEERYYAHPVDLAQLSFAVERIETWLPEKHFEEAGDPANVAFKIASMWLRAQHNFVEALDARPSNTPEYENFVEDQLKEYGEEGGWPITRYDDLEDYDGTVYRLVWSVHVSFKQAVAYNRKEGRMHTT